jgi:2,4-dienoyl-CoA reductase-like NADH-dependent reductase (Old Yellow Enzyme family)
MHDDVPSSAALLQPLTLRTTTLANRLGLGPVNPGFFDGGGRLSRVAQVFYSTYADATLGIVYVGGVAVCSAGRSNQGSLVITQPGGAAALESVATVTKRMGTAFAVQLMHSGRQASSREIGHRLVAASPIPCDVHRETPRQATARDIAAIIGWFRDAAGTAQRAGADVVEIHAAHGYLLSGFLSRHSNTRADGYGGSVRNRFRLLAEVILATREAAASCDVGIRVNVAENVDMGGLDVDELIEGLLPLRDAVDFVSVTAGIYTTGTDWIMPPRTLGQAPWRSRAKTLRDAMGKPVFLAGNIDSVSLADSLVREGFTDVCLMVRALLADPLLLRKWVAGRAGEVRACTDLLLCKYHSRGRSAVYCPHNVPLKELRRKRAR